MSTYECVLECWEAMRARRDKAKDQQLDLLTMRLRDAVRPECVLRRLHDRGCRGLEELLLFETRCDQDLCDAAVERVLAGARLPGLDLTSSCQAFYLKKT